MSSLSQVLKAEILRLSRKEVKAFVAPLRKSNSGLRRNVSDLRKKIAFLEFENKRLEGFYKISQKKQAQITPEVVQKVRVTSKGIKALRRKLGLSQEALAKLLCVSSQAVYAMEKKGGRVRLRSVTLANLLTLRGLGRREVKRRLEEVAGKKTVVKKIPPKKNRKSKKN